MRSWLEMKPFLRSRMEAVGVVILVFFVCVCGVWVCVGGTRLVAGLDWLEARGFWTWEGGREGWLMQAKGLSVCLSV